MHIYRSVSSALLLLLTADVSAALVPQAAATETRFYTTADFSSAAHRKYMGKGFWIGFAQQAATCLAAGTWLDADPAAQALIVQWPLFFFGSLGAYALAHDNVCQLQNYKTASFLLHQELQKQKSAFINFATFATQYEQMRTDEEVTCQACTPQEMYATHNTFLLKQCKKVAFIRGYIIASLLGPLAPLFIASTLAKLY